MNKGNYADHSPRYGMEDVSGVSLRSLRRDSVALNTSDSFYPGQFVFTLKLDECWRSCYTAHDASFVRTAAYNNRLVLSKGLTLEFIRVMLERRLGSGS